MKMMKNAVEEKAYENQEAYQRTQMQKDMIFERLREQGCRITRQRQLILDIILEEECSCCKEIYYKVQEKDRNIGPATIYRMVNMLEKIGAISRKNMYRIFSCEASCSRTSAASRCGRPSKRHSAGRYTDSPRCCPRRFCRSSANRSGSNPDPPSGRSGYPAPAA